MGSKHLIAFQQSNIEHFGSSLLRSEARESLFIYYEKNYDNIISNCDTRLFLGGNDPTTLEYINKQLGKETIQTNTYGHSRGRSGQYSTNLQQTGRDLMTPDELARLDKRDSILLLRGEYPIRDRKIDVTRHPNAEKTTVMVERKTRNRSVLQNRAAAKRKSKQQSAGKREFDASQSKPINTPPRHICTFALYFGGAIL